MSDTFREYLKAEIDAIMKSMDEKYRKDPQLRCKRAIDWIDENAEQFRRQWNKKMRPKSV